MPPPLNHEQCRAKLCILCVKKDQKKRKVGPISAAVRAKIVEHIPALVNDDPRLPNGICTSCRVAFNPSSRNVLPPIYDYRYL